MEYDLFKEWIPSITEKTAYLFDGDEDQIASKYPSFMVNRALSQYQDCVFAANELQKFPMLDPKLQYDFLFSFIPAKKRFAKWGKSSKNSDVELVKQCYSVNTKRAEEILELLDEEDLQKMREWLDTGGKKK